MKKLFTSTAAIAAMTLSSMNPSMAKNTTNDIVVQSIKVECTTKSTGINGVRNDCYSDWTYLKAPAGYVINEKASTVRLTSGNGSTAICEKKFDGYVEIIPGTGIKQPTSVQIRSHAVSPKGHASGRGWAHCEANVTMTKLP
ncbi:hypothetical protein LCM28_25585 [Salipiger pacificus]|nr:hypothetical protein [Alloyangia pacifica]